MATVICQWCKGFGILERMVSYSGKLWHPECYEELQLLARRVGSLL